MIVDFRSSSLIFAKALEEAIKDRGAEENDERTLEDFKEGFTAGWIQSKIHTLDVLSSFQKESPDGEE